MECDINPLIASPEGILSLDSRVLLHDRSVAELPRSAIRSYPHEYVKEVELGGSKITVRPVLPEDEDAMFAFYSQAAWPDGCDPSKPVEEEELPADTCRLAPPVDSSKVNRSHLIKTCFTDFDRSVVIVAEGQVHGEKVIMGAGRVTKKPMSKDMTFALQVLPAHRKIGLGGELLTQLVEIGRREGARGIRAKVNTSNDRALRFLKQHGFTTSAVPGRPDVLLAECLSK
eukprot:SRR837773.18284.p2 GENE.SRR837773.18284~~SRR837773.18284.p2  ORF type:complete len:248 (-),score=104.88 SRR837773.18284:45-731(-)